MEILEYQTKHINDELRYQLKGKELSLFLGGEAGSPTLKVDLSHPKIELNETSKFSPPFKRGLLVLLIPIPVIVVFYLTEGSIEAAFQSRVLFVIGISLALALNFMFRFPPKSTTTEVLINEIGINIVKGTEVDAYQKFTAAVRRAIDEN